MTDLVKLLMLHARSGSVDPEAGRWLIPHMYAEGISSAWTRTTMARLPDRPTQECTFCGAEDTDGARAPLKLNDGTRTTGYLCGDCHPNPPTNQLVYRDSR